MLTKMYSCYECLTCFGKKFQAPIMLLLRLFFGWQLISAGLGKLTNIETTAGFFEALEIPLPIVNAYLVGVIESLGGLMLLVGFMARVAALPLIAVMATAAATAHIEEVSQIFTKPLLALHADPVIFLLVVILVFAYGPGCWSIDAYMMCKANKCCDGTPAGVPPTGVTD